jgi:hypothetical protein
MHYEPGKPILYPPWIDGSLVTCRIDVSDKEVPEGVMTTRVTPAMAAGLTDKVMDMADVVKLIDEYDASRKTKAA